ncbi:MAG TPA: hypothetical protein VFB12_02165 [Ktedonobacteraceae bacterium]|nr:hypothetical protein [Ktedonobacteraceae bacterium]
MKHQDTESTATNNFQATCAELPEKPHRGTIQWTAIFARLHNYLSGRTNANDQEILRFCLYQLFHSMDTLYQTALPQLAASASHDTNSKVYLHYHTWHQLQHIQRVLERMESLCHLLNDTMNTVLNDLDRTAKQAQSPIDAEDETWHASHEQAITDLSIYLDRWQQCNQQRLPIAAQFADYLSVVPALAQTDLACQSILESANAIFSLILPAFPATTHYDDAAAIISLLDLLQRIDQLLLHTNLLLPVLHTLIKHYSIYAQIH